MGKNCVITLEEAIVVKASENAHKQGKSLKEVIEGTIIDMAENNADGPWITERALETLDWAPSRVSLYQMRKDKRLKVDEHYKRQGRFIYYNKEKLKEALDPAPATPPPASSHQTSRISK